MAERFLWKIYCETEGDWKSIWKTSGEQTVCPLNAAHTVSSGSQSIVRHQKSSRPKNTIKLFDPTLTDDITKGYSVCSSWVNTANNNDWVCCDNSAGAAVWEKRTGGSAPSVTEVSATSTTTTTSNTAAIINSMTNTPSSGDYLVQFSASGAHSDSESNAFYGIYINNVLVAHSKRSFGWEGDEDIDGHRKTMHTQAKVTVTGSEQIEIRWSRGSTGTFSCYERSMILIKVV